MRSATNDNAVGLTSIKPPFMSLIPEHLNVLTSGREYEEGGSTCSLPSGASGRRR